MSESQEQVSHEIKATGKKELSATVNTIDSPEEQVITTLGERHPDWPPIKLNFFFGPHRTAKDIAGMEDHITESDIYIYEGIDDGNENTPFYQGLADADPERLPPDYMDRIIRTHSLQGTPYESIARSLYGSKKVVGHIDLRPGDQITNQDFDEVAERSYMRPTFDETLTAFRKNEEDYVKLDDEREKIMVDRFEAEIQTILTAHSELKNKPGIKILATIGASHTPLFYKFREKGIDTERTFSNEPYIYDFQTELARKIAFLREPSRDLLARAYFTEVIGDLLPDTFSSSYPEKIYLRQVALKFTIPEIERIYEQDRDGELTADVFNELLRAKDLDPLPSSDQELNDSVVKQKTPEEAWLRERKARIQQRRQAQE